MFRLLSVTILFCLCVCVTLTISPSHPHSPSRLGVGLFACLTESSIHAYYSMSLSLCLSYSHHLTHLTFSSPQSVSLGCEFARLFDFESSIHAYYSMSLSLPVLLSSSHPSHPSHLLIPTVRLAWVWVCSPV